MRKLLWVGDAACDSGFARCTHETVEGFRRNGWAIEVLGINYRGRPHKYPYPIEPALLLGQRGGDILGTQRLAERITEFQPDVVILQNDPWNIPKYLNKLKFASARRPLLVGAIAVDAANCRGGDLNGLDHVVFWTQFAEQEARRGGFERPASVVPLGVNLDVFKPGDRLAARKTFLPESLWDKFIVLNVNRNQPRKRLDLTVEYFADWYHTDQPDAYLMLHVCPTGDQGWDIAQLARYYGLKGRVLLSQPDTFKGLPEDEVVQNYQAADVQISTTLGEGWGLTTMEGMACGVPQVVPSWSALAEWATAAIQIPCHYTAAAPVINTIWGIADRTCFVNALRELYADANTRAMYAREGLKLVSRPEYRWSNIAARFAFEVEDALRRFHEGRSEVSPQPAQVSAASA